MPDASKSIFLDLEIDIELMTQDQDSFVQQVYERADFLLSILNSKTSLKGARSEASKKAETNEEAKVKAKNWFYQKTSVVNDEMEDLSLDELYHTINEARELVKDLELLFHSKANTEMIMGSPSAMDKGLAHEQYTRLRNAFNTFREFCKLMYEKNYVPLDPKSGNYGDANITWPTYKYQGAVYQNYRAVAKLLGWNPDDFHNNQDLVDKIKETGAPVEIVEVSS